MGAGVLMMARKPNGGLKETVSWSAEIELVEALDEYRNSLFPVPDRSQVISEAVNQFLFGKLGRCGKRSADEK